MHLAAYTRKWDLGYLLPKRDIGCFDPEDLPIHKLRNSLIKKRDYYNQVPEMYNILEERNILDEFDELMDDDIMFLQIPPLPLWYTITPEELFYLGLNKEEVERQRVAEESIENYRKEVIESLEDAFWMDTRNRFFGKLLKDNEQYETQFTRELDTNEVYEMLEDILKDSTIKPEVIEEITSYIEEIYRRNK